MTIYLVRRYANKLPADEFGVDDSYTLIGVFSSEAMAQRAKAQVEQETLAEKEAFQKQVQQIHEFRKKNWEKAVPNKPFPEKEDLENLMQDAPVPPEIDIIEVELDKRYAIGEEPELSGGTYIK